jgi:hypothetical protein
MDAFDPNDPNDAACERERKAFSNFILERMCGDESPESTAPVLIGALMGVCAIVFANFDGVPGDEQLAALHKAVDACWSQTAGIRRNGESIQ